jgi:hypothetical protein
VPGGTFILPIGASSSLWPTNPSIGQAEARRAAGAGRRHGGGRPGRRQRTGGHLSDASVYLTGAFLIYAPTPRLV